MKVGKVSGRVVGLFLAVSLGAASCVEEPQGEAGAEALELPTEGKADAGVISGPVLVAIVGTVITLVVAAKVVHEANADLQQIIESALQRWQWEKAMEAEERDHAEFIERGLNRVAYNNRSYGGSMTAGSFLNFISAVESLSVETTMTYGADAGRFFRDARVLAVKARHDSDYRNGGCIIANVEGLKTGGIFEGKARYFSPEDVLAAIAAASLSATGQCGAADPDVLDALGAAVPSSPVTFTLDSFLYYGWHNILVLGEFRAACSMPPSLAISKNAALCE